MNGSSDDDDDQETGEDERESVTTSSIGEERLNTDTDNKRYKWPHLASGHDPLWSQGLLVFIAQQLVLSANILN